MEPFERISVQKAQEIISTGNKVNIVDIRDARSFAQGHLPQAKSVNDENLEVFIQTTDKETPLVCYCYHGFSSQQAALFFVNKGFKQVYSIEGGWEEWKTVYG